jgi:hypothetical protein
MVETLHWDRSYCRSWSALTGEQAHQTLPLQTFVAGTCMTKTTLVAAGAEATKQPLCAVAEMLVVAAEEAAFHDVWSFWSSLSGGPTNRPMQGRRTHPGATECRHQATTHSTLYDFLQHQIVGETVAGVTHVAKGAAEAEVEDGGSPLTTLAAEEVVFLSTAQMFAAQLRRT